MRHYGQLVRIVATYAVLSAAWIVVTDMLVVQLVQDSQLLTIWQTAKGWIFVAMSSLLIWALLWHEMSLRRTSDLAATDARRRFEKIFRNNAAAQAITTLADGRFVEVNQAFTAMFGFARDELIGRSASELGIWAGTQERRRSVSHLLGPDGLHAKESTFHDRRGIAVEGVWSAERLDLDGVPHILSAIIDVSAHKRSERRVAELNDEVRERIGRLEALHQIDVAITENRDLATTLDVVLEQMCIKLTIDSAAILLADPETGEFEFGATRGYRTSEPRRIAFALGRWCVRADPGITQTIHLSCEAVEAALSNVESATDEGFEEALAVPLRTHGAFEGLLIVATRSPLETGDDWMGFLRALALQAAIAVANARLLEGLERSNRELQHAYERTIEGWAHALDLKDEETQGHSLRVTELTERLALRLGVPTEDMMHIRYGALLHDIGKIGVPDQILLKPGRLTDEERALMQRHTDYAREMLENIAFLDRAIAIPYCHHERWDGTGYPRGLAGEKIPFPARMFAVVDVYDALSSDRPYRPAWDKEQVVAHLRAERGSHFDPAVTDAFLELIGA